MIISYMMHSQTSSLRARRVHANFNHWKFPYKLQYHTKKPCKHFTICPITARISTFNSSFIIWLEPLFRAFFFEPIKYKYIWSSSSIGDLMDEEEVLDWLTDPDQLESNEHIERVNQKMFERVLKRSDFLAVFFCNYSFWLPLLKECLLGPT